ncbi:zinc carboxypeptidase-like [Ostrinia furnacalis]|uniref:zinc carboxypeptidase-like n=1 Tax=Ostrinia furnacalis TaxID=93504 RepID=UPI0010400990|nr:zinc carboxypeptidase-like [Ostrinia furnacalis]
MKSIILVVLGLVWCVYCEKFRFDNYTLYKLYPKTEAQITLLQNLQDNEQQYDFWSDPVPKAEHVMVLSSPENKISLESIMNGNSVGFEIAHENIQELIDRQTVAPFTKNAKMTWDQYHTLDSIYAWLDSLVIEYPNLVSEIIGGSSYERRQIKGVKISHGNNKKAIFIEGGIHSREWISPATVTYIINDLLTSTDKETQAAAKEFDWYIFPVTNPDGYVWSHESFRLWRKNRRPIEGTTFGVDLNRNWNNNWLAQGASTNPSSDSYAGPGPFSEIETRSLSTYIESIGDKIELYLSFHSFSQLLLIPFGNTTEPVANYHDALNIGRRAMGALSVRYGTQYVTGNIAEAIYLATGGSVDWVKEHVQVPLVYCYELRDRGTYSFLLPPEEILPSGLETMDSLVELIHQAKRFGYMNNGTSIIGVSMMTIVFLLIAIVI